MYTGAITGTENCTHVRGASYVMKYEYCLTHTPTLRPALHRCNSICYIPSDPPVAQSVEQLPFKQLVVGSIPTGRTYYKKPPYMEVFYNMSYFLKND